MVVLYQAQSDHKYCFLTMEYLPNIDIFEVLRSMQRPFNGYEEEKRVGKWVAQAASALGLCLLKITVLRNFILFF